MSQGLTVMQPFQCRMLIQCLPILLNFLGQLKTLNLVPLFFKYKHQICVNQHQIKIYSKCDKGVWSAFFHCICTGAMVITLLQSWEKIVDFSSFYSPLSPQYNVGLRSYPLEIDTIH